MQKNDLLQIVSGSRDEEHRPSFEALTRVFRDGQMYFVSGFLVRIREYSIGLDVAEYSLDLLEEHADELEPHDLRNWTQQAMLMKLDMLDRLNKWPEYVEYFNLLRGQTGDRYIAAGYFEEAHADIEMLRPYIVARSAGQLRAHFLYFVGYRYEIILRKLDRSKQGKSTEHLKRHQSDRLTDAEIRRRAEEYIAWHNDFHR